MSNKFIEDLKGSADEAIASQKLIAKYFTNYGLTGSADASKHQLIYAANVMHTIAKCELKHPKIYCDIVVNVFADLLKPESSAKYWDTYVDSFRFFHYSLVTKKEYEMASLLYNHISLYNDKLESENVCLKLVNIYSYHLFLQKSLLSSNQETALREAHNVVDNLTFLFQEMLQKNRQLNFQYKDVLKKMLQWFFPGTEPSKVTQFFNMLSGQKLSAMFESIFKLCTQQRMPKEDMQQNVPCVMETLYALLQFDIRNKFQLKLSVQLLSHYRVDKQITLDKPIAELCQLLYDYMKLVCLQTRVADIPKQFTRCCERFKELFDVHSKSLISQLWFRDYLVLLNYLHTQMQNTIVFACFWEQMSTPECFKSLLSLMLETMKLAPCITSDTSLNWIKCCSSFRKHIILSHAQIALSTFVLYCQNVTDEQENEEATTGATPYSDGLHKTLILIVNHAFKVIEKMDCITSTSQDMYHLITGFKQAAISAKTEKQANTCMALCELFLKIKSKMSESEWPLMLRRLYKVIEQCKPNNIQLKRELQMCYITAMLELSSELDIMQIRAQITIYYLQNSTNEQETAPSELQHDKCLLYMFQHSTNALRPHLNPGRKKLLHWLETQHIVKYYKSNEKLMQSLMQCSRTQYDFVMIARLEKSQTSHVRTKLVAIQRSLKAKAEESEGLSRLELLTYGHTVAAILQDQKNVLMQKTSKLESKDFSEPQFDNLLARSEMETMTLRKELSYVKLAYVAFKAFKEFYEKFDLEHISSDDAVIDWEAVINDLAALANFFHLGGYIEYCSHVWVLIYRISQFVQDIFSVLRALAFICEYSEYFKENKDSAFEIDNEIQLHLKAITDILEKLPTLQTRNQTYVLLTTIQIANYYARCSKYAYAQMLLQFVEQKHHELPERQKQYDIVMCTLDMVRYRLLWKHFKDDSTTTNKLLSQNLMHEIELTLDRLRNFVYLSSSDSLMYMILLCNLLQDIAECSANRLYDNFMSNIFSAVCKFAVTHGFALRMVQAMSLWMWNNLQMEFVDEAHTKLRIIEYIMGIATLKELMENKISTATTVDIKSNSLVTSPSMDILSLGHNTGIEAMRRLAQAQLSPIKTGKLQLRSLARKHDLKSYLNYKIEMTSMPSSELFEWIYFIIACLNARLNFLIEDFDQLEDFYEKGSKWLQNRQNDFHKRYFQNFQLVAIQHYANFLRASRKNEKAMECLKYALVLCENFGKDIDVVYRINFKLQLMSTCMVDTNFMENNFTGKYSKTPKTLSFNLSPEENIHDHDKAKQALRNHMLQQAMCSSRKPSATPSSSSGSCLSTKAKKNNKILSGTSSPEAKNKIKTKLKFNIGTDSIEIMDLSINPDWMEFKTTNKHEMKCNDSERTDQRSSKTDKKLTKTPSKSKTSDKQTLVTVDLLDSPPKSSSIITSTSSSSSMECLEIKEIESETDLVKQMDKLKMTETKTKVSRKTPPGRNANSIPIIVLDDSLDAKLLEKASRSRARNKQKPDAVKESTEKIKGNETPLSRSRFRNNSKEPSTSVTSSSSAIATPSVSTRRRQKI